ncbi:MAG: hypothetical protein ACK6DY_07755 [Acidobacteriota bacterium]
MRRRDLASLLLAGLPAPAPPPPPAPSANQAAARQRVQAASAELARFAVPIALEPATSFKAY